MATGGLAPAATGNGTFVALGRESRLPADFAAGIAAAGGEVVYSVPEIGLAVVRSSKADFASRAARIKGLESVTPDIVIPMVPVSSETPQISDVGGPSAAPELVDPPFTDDDDGFFDLQWSMDALDWTDAVGISSVRGQGVRVAILDSGILSTHNEFQSNLNTALSTSFVPGETFDSPAGFHGTHVSGIVAAADNGLGTIGVAPEVELVMVKVLSAITGSGSFAGAAAGLVYAGNIGADVANMSFGAHFGLDGKLLSNCVVVGQTTPQAVQAIITLMSRAANYAERRGVTLIGSAGNCAFNSDEDPNIVHVPSILPQVLAISASAPVGWGLDPDTNLDLLASYSSLGSEIAFGAPGGDSALRSGALCTILTGPNNVPVTVPCWVFDLVLSASNASPTTYSWAGGTSMSSPAAVGVAALIISKNGGSMSPASVKAAMEGAVNFDDGGRFAPGLTPQFGHGLLSALEALQ
jgi:subtilisin family serine protease